jgi:hypothetical protein
MVAGLNGLVLKIFLNTGQIQNVFQIWPKNKKNRYGEDDRHWLFFVGAVKD